MKNSESKKYKTSTDEFNYKLHKTKEKSSELEDGSYKNLDWSMENQKM